MAAERFCITEICLDLMNSVGSNNDVLSDYLIEAVCDSVWRIGVRSTDTDKIPLVNVSCMR